MKPTPESRKNRQRKMQKRRKCNLKAANPTFINKASMQSSSSVGEQTIGFFSKDPAVGSDGRPSHESKGIYFPEDTHETDENAKKLLTRHQRDLYKREQNPFLLLNDLTELGMFGEFPRINAISPCHSKTYTA
jgi:hypothetical protein